MFRMAGQWSPGRVLLSTKAWVKLSEALTAADTGEEFSQHHTHESSLESEEGLTVINILKYTPLITARSCSKSSFGPHKGEIL